MKYKILRTDKAEEQLREIIFYIADDSGDIDIALRYLEKIETAINRLQVSVKNFTHTSVPAKMRQLT